MSQADYHSINSVEPETEHEVDDNEVPLSIQVSGSDSEKNNKIKFNDDFPYHMAYVSIARYSDNLNKHDKSNRKSIICGGYRQNETVFHEIINVSLNCSNVELKSFDKDYNKANANLSKIGFRSAEDTFSFITDNNENIIVFNNNEGYNVYSMKNDSWLLKKNSKQLKFCYRGSRCLLINDELIVICDKTKLLFYNLKDLKNPILVREYDIEAVKSDERKNEEMGNAIETEKEIDDEKERNETKDNETGKEKEKENEKEKEKEKEKDGNGYVYHGMCLIDYGLDFVFSSGIASNNNNDNVNENENENKKLFSNYHFSFVLFGGMNFDSPFNDSIIEFFVSITNNKDSMKVVSIKENKIENNNSILNSKLFSFGYQCVFNLQNEAILIIIGGENNENSIILYNYQTKKEITKDKILPFYSRYCPLTLLNENVLLVASNENYTSYDLSSLIENYKGYGLFSNQVKKKTENENQIGKSTLAAPHGSDNNAEITYSGDVSKGSSMDNSLREMA